MFSPPLIPLISFSPPYPPNFVFSFNKKNTQTCVCAHTLTPHIHTKPHKNENKKKRRVHKNIIEFVLYWLTTECEVYPKGWLIYSSEIPLVKNWFSLCQCTVSIVGGFLVRGSPMCPLAPLSAWTLSGLYVLMQVLLSVASLYEFICASVLMCPENMHSLVLFITSGS